MTRVVAEPPTDQPYADIVQTGRFTWQVSIIDTMPQSPFLAFISPELRRYTVNAWTVLGHARAEAKADRELRKHTIRKQRAATVLHVIGGDE